MSNEWYTSPKYADAARHVMGGIKSDPASCAVANQFIKDAHEHLQQQRAEELKHSLWAALESEVYP